MADIQEALFKAIDEIVGKRIEAVRFDETIKAIVVDVSTAAEGKYTVDTGAAQFTAYSTTKYNENDTVLVTIPQGNYDNQKIIIGKSVSGTDTPLIVKRPFDDFIDLTHNIASNYTGTTSFQANGNNTNYQWLEENNYPITATPIWTWGFNNGALVPSGQIQRYTRLGIQAQFSTWLNEYDVIDGNYGLALQIFLKAAETNTYFTQLLVLDSDTFFGNPYNFETYYTQEEVFDISNVIDYPIVGMKLFAYERNNFITVTGDELVYDIEEDQMAGFFSAAGDNIFIKDINICLGEAAEEFEYDTAEIMCDSALTYHKTYATDEDFTERAAANLKNIELRWIHQDEETNRIAVIDDLPSGYEIRWYKYKIGAPSPDRFAGAHWERFYGSKTVVDEDIQATEIWDFDTEQNPAITTNNIDIKFQPNVNLETEQIKAIVIKVEEDQNLNLQEKKIASSNILEFVNDDEIRSQVTLIDANALSIRYEDDEKGHYFLYDESGDIGSQEDLEIRILTAVFDPSGEKISVEDKPILNVDDCYSIKWTFPSENTMIVPMTGISPDSTPSTELEFNNVNQVGFTIKKHLNNNATQNTILLEIVTGGQNYLAQIQPIFGTAGSNGSDYTLIINWRDNKNALNLSQSNGVLIEPEGLVGDVVLFDQAGNTIPIPEGAEITCGWKVAEFGNHEIRVKEEETEDLLYPVFTDTSDNRLLVYNLANNPDANYQGESFYYFLDNNRLSEVSYYSYDVENKQFQLDTDSTISGEQLYRKKQSTEKKYKLEFKPITFAEDPLNQESGIVSSTYNNTPITVTESNGEYVKSYHYSRYHRYFIKMNDQYILDPWEDYQEVETYYEPIEATEKNYVVDIETGNIFDNDSVAQGGLIAVADTDEATVTITATTDTNINSLFILEVKLTNFGDYDLTAYYPIALKDNEVINNSGQKTKVINYIEGPDRVRYGSSGETDFNKNVYQITVEKWESNQFVKYRHGYQDNGNDLNGYWKLLFPRRLNNYEDGFQPMLQETVIDEETHQVKVVSNGKYDIPKLMPISIYIPDAIPYGVQFVEVNNNVEKVLWTQPILVYENKYPSATLNKWNGEDIETDKEHGTITASGFAAGKKERDNTFTGVVIGDWSRTKMDAAVAKNTGVYGFNHGAMSYAFKDDGTGFIGKDGKGRIYLDGDKSQIYSSNWANQNDPQGMLLDIDDGYIKMKKGTITYDYIWQTPTSAAYALSITEIDENNISNWDKNKEQYFYWNNNAYHYANDGLSGYTAIYAYYLRKASTTANRFITLGVNQNTFPFSIGTDQNVSARNFRVDWDGIAYINKGVFKGTITGSEVYTNYLEAYNGTIGGWTIDSTSLSGGNTTLDAYSGINTNYITITGNGAGGVIGQTVGFADGNTTKLLGIKTTSGDGIALETLGNIRLAGTGSNSIIQLQCKQFAIGPIYDSSVYDKRIIEYSSDVNVGLTFNLPATAQHGIYARFA